MTSAKWTSNSDAINERVHAAQVEATTDIVEDLSAQSAAVLPYQEGDLDRSRKTTVDGSGTTVEGVVSYDTVYARVQHEHPEFQHQDGRTYNYLGGPFNANHARYTALLAERTRAALDG